MFLKPTKKLIKMSASINGKNSYSALVFSKHIQTKKINAVVKVPDSNIYLTFKMIKNKDPLKNLSKIYNLFFKKLMGGIYH